MVDATPARSLTETLALRAEKTPDRTAYIFLTDGEEEQDRLTYAALNARARAIAAALARSFRPGERALLLDPPGLDFVAAFFGCLYAGVIAVPAYPPRSPRKMPRLLAILADARPAVALASAASLQKVRGWFERTPAAGELSWLATDEVDPAPTGWTPTAPARDAVAFLQYTSGSTSTPKGVAVTQANLTHNQRVIQGACGHSEESVFVSWLPVYHDLGLIGNLLQATWVGAPCVLMAPVAFLQSPSRWLRAISRYRGTTSGGPNFAYDLCVRRVAPADVERLDLSSWQIAFNGAEPVREETLARFAEAFAPAGFRPGAHYPCYGLAETTLMVSGGRPGTEPVVRELGGRRLVGCGRVLSDLEVAIVDPETRRPCAAGAVGEIWVAGGSVAQGYWNRPEETAETFGATLADGRGRWLRTGDLGALDVQAGGELFIAGRLKDLIILRGRNLFPQDLEATAREAHPALAEGTGAAFSVDLEGEERLVTVHEVERHAARPDEIAAAVRQRIAEEHETLTYEVVLVAPGGVPRTTSGKVQRRACRDLYLQGELRSLGVSRLAPGAAQETPWIEEPLGSLDWLRRAFAAAARIDPARIDPDRPLSASGLDSLAGVELQHAIEEATGVSLPLSDLLEGMTLRELERQVGAIPSLPRAPRPPGEGTPAGEHPLSWNQRSLWFLHRLAPESPAYNIAGAARLSPSPADPESLGRAFQKLVDRHPMLCATFADTAGGPVQRMAERAVASFETVDATGWNDAEIHGRLHAEAFRPFDLSTGPLLRAALLQRGDEAFLVLAVHHIAADFWSMTVLARELGALTAGEPLRPAAALYTDFARRQQEMLESPKGERLWEHWRERLAGTPQLDLPTDHPRPPVQMLRGGSRSFPPSPEQLEALHRLAATHGCTPFVALLATWQAVLSRWSGQEDLLVGSPMAGRSALEWRDVVGYFVNPVPLRADLSGEPTVRELMAQARSTTLDALAHQELPFALLAERLQPERDPSRPPLFAALLAFEKTTAAELAPLAAFAVGVPGVRLALGELVLESLPLAPPAAQLDLSLMAAELSEGLAVFLQWDADLFDATTIERMAGHLGALLAAAAEAPGRRLSDLPLLTGAESAQLLIEWNDTRRPAPEDLCLHDLFTASATLRPDAIAAVDEGRSLSYGTLGDRAARLANRLRAADVGPEALVGICLDEGLERLVAVLGVFLAGGAYLPLDPGHPRERLAYMIEDARVRVVLTRGSLAGSLPATVEAMLLEDGEVEPGRPGRQARWPARVDNLAYVIYTSGSTGRPNGVMVAHGPAVRLILYAVEQAGLGPHSRVLQFVSFTFDASVLETWTALASGGTLCIASREARVSSDLLGSLAHREQITYAVGAPSALALLPEDLSTLDTFLVGGDRCPAELASRWAPPASGLRLLFNCFGPTETTIYTASADLRGSYRREPPIGWPIANTRIHLLDRRLRLAPLGAQGEICVGGAGLARGYLGRPRLTAERFVPDPLAEGMGQPGDRLYRTGDLARRLPDGRLEILGRLDHQVKIRGLRIELGEIEAELAALPGVREVVVMAREDRSGGRRLVAYIVGDATEASLRQALRERLPDYMVPAAFVRLPALPITPHGKVDRKALPAPAWQSQEESRLAPRTPIEEVLAAIWADVLGLEQVGAADHFFDLGGHSLLATRVISRLRAAFGVEMPLRDLFAAPRLTDFAVRIEAARRMGTGFLLPPLVPVPRERPLPLSFAQQRLWFVHQLEPDSSAYNIPVMLRVEGPLSPGVLARSLGEIIRRHEVLRTVFAAQEGSAEQVIQPEAPFALPLVDLSGLPERERESASLGLADGEAVRPFDLTRGPLLRCVLLRMSEGDHRVTLTMHHIVSDGWSMRILIRELVELYPAFAAGRPSPLPELPVQYADFSVWQRSWLCGEVMDALSQHWKSRLAGAPAVTELPFDHPWTPQSGNRGARQSFTIPRDLSDSLRRVAREQDATLFMVLLAAFNTLLFCHSGQEDLVVGANAAGRVSAEVEDLIGFFINMLALRSDLSGNPTFRELLQRVRERTLEAYSHQEMPFAKVVDELHLERSLSRTPLFQAVFTLQPALPSIVAIPASGLTLTGMGLEVEAIHYDLTFNLSEEPAGITGFVFYNARLFEAATITRLMEKYSALLGIVVATPERRLSEIRGELFGSLPDVQGKEFGLVARSAFKSIRRQAVVPEPSVASEGVNDVR